MIYTSNVMDKLEGFLDGSVQKISQISAYEITKRSNHIDVVLFALYGTPMTVTFTEKDFKYINSKMYPDSYIVQIYLERSIKAIEDLVLTNRNSDKSYKYQYKKDSMLEYIESQAQKHTDIAIYKQIQDIFKDILKDTFGIVTIPV